MRYSGISCYHQCPYKYKLQYLDNLKVEKPLTPDDARTVGTTIHMGIEIGIEKAIKWYTEQYPEMTDAHNIEIHKILILYGKVQELIEDFPIILVKQEVPFAHDEWTGTVDAICDLQDGTYMIADWKYSNNVQNYVESAQLHLYKHFIEATTNYKISKLAFVFLPKCSLKRTKRETYENYKNRITEALDNMNIKMAFLEFNQSIVDAELELAKIIPELGYEPKPNRFCNFCDYKELCLKEMMK